MCLFSMLAAAKFSVCSCVMGAESHLELAGFYFLCAVGAVTRGLVTEAPASNVVLVG